MLALTRTTTTAQDRTIVLKANGYTCAVIEILRVEGPYRVRVGLTLADWLVALRAELDPHAPLAPTYDNMDWDGTGRGCLYDEAAARRALTRRPAMEVR